MTTTGNTAEKALSDGTKRLLVIAGVCFVIAVILVSLCVVLYFLSSKRKTTSSKSKPGGEEKQATSAGEGDQNAAVDV